MCSRGSIPSANGMDIGAMVDEGPNTNRDNIEAHGPISCLGSQNFKSELQMNCISVKSTSAFPEVG